MLSVAQSAFCTRRFENNVVEHLGVSKCGNNILSYRYRAAYGTVLTVAYTVIGTGGCCALVNDLVMSLCSLQSYTADKAYLIVKTANLAKYVQASLKLNCVIIVGALICACALSIGNDYCAVGYAVAICKNRCKSGVGIYSDILAKSLLKCGYLSAVFSLDKAILNGYCAVIRSKSVKSVSYGIEYRVAIQALKNVIKVNSLACNVGLFKLRIGKSVEGVGNTNRVLCTVDTDIDVLCKLAKGYGHYHRNLVPFTALHSGENGCCRLKRNIINSNYHSVRECDRVTVKGHLRTSVPSVCTKNTVGIGHYRLGEELKRCVLLKHKRKLECVILAVIFVFLHHVEGGLLFYVPLIYEVALRLTANARYSRDISCNLPGHSRRAIANAHVNVKVKVALGGCSVNDGAKLTCLSIDKILTRTNRGKHLLSLIKRGGIACHINCIKEGRIELFCLLYKVKKLGTVGISKLSRGCGDLPKRCTGICLGVLEGKAYLLCLCKSEIELAIALTAYTDEGCAADKSSPLAVGIYLNEGVITSARSLVPVTEVIDAYGLDVVGCGKVNGNGEGCVLLIHGSKSRL